MTDDRLKDQKFVKWAHDIKTRDNFCCIICGKRGGAKIAHHLFSWDVYPELRYNLDNGVTICAQEHTKFHDLYGYGQNTKFQFEEFKAFMQKIKQIVAANINKKDQKDNDS